MGHFMEMPGIQVFTTTDGVVGTSGKPIRVFDIILISGGTASQVIMRNGTTTGGTPYIQLDGTISKMTTFSSNNGILFKDGCFADVDANTAELIVSFWQEV